MIPKKIHYCWVGGKPLPKSAVKCIKSWKKYCPDYEIIEWNETNYDFTKNEYMKQAYEAKKWGFVPDYARLDIIYTCGGIYLDTDVEIVKSFDSLLNLKGFAGFEDDESVALGLGFGAEKGNAVIKKLRDSYENLSFINEDGSINLTPAPEVNQPIFDELGLIHNGECQMLDDFSVFSKDYFCPKSLYDGVIRKTENTYSIHQFDASWFSKEGNKEKSDRWKQKQKKAKKTERHAKIKNIIFKFGGEKIYKKIRKG